MRMSDRKLEEARYFLTRRMMDQVRKVSDARKNKIDEDWFKSSAGKEENKLRDKIAKLELEKRKEYDKLNELISERENQKVKISKWYEEISYDFDKKAEEKLVMIGLGASAADVMQELINEINNLK